MNLLVLGLQWGDEGKGKAIDYLAGDFDVVVRYQGGHNAGHTVYSGGERFVLHLLPSGIFSPGSVSVIAAGVVVDPLALVAEIRAAVPHGLDLGRLVLSEAAPLILPFHQQLDIIFEESRYLKIGTTRRGIGPAYEDRAGRRAVFVRDLLDEGRFVRAVKPLGEYYNKLIQAYGGEGVAIDDYLAEYIAAGRFLAPIVDDTTYRLNRLHAEGKRMLFEGAQGALLDITLGTYPYVTSSHPTAGGVLIGTGLPPQALGRIVGISKAYATRVGEGPFPTELTCQTGERLREAGGEYGATTGRPRRVGWLDLVALKYAVMINGVTSIFLTKLDVLAGMEKISAAISYEIDGERGERFSTHFDRLQRVRPLYREFPGWPAMSGKIAGRGDLPRELGAYIAFIEEYLGVPVEYLSYGAGREETLHLA